MQAGLFHSFHLCDHILNWIVYTCCPICSITVCEAESKQVEFIFSFSFCLELFTRFIRFVVSNFPLLFCFLFFLSTLLLNLFDLFLFVRCLFPDSNPCLGEQTFHRFPASALPYSLCFVPSFFFIYSVSYVCFFRFNQCSVEVPLDRDDYHLWIE